MSDLKDLANEIREINGLNGWNLWQREHFETEPYKFGAVCALIHSEVSEALEWNRQMGKSGVIINDKIMNKKDITKMLTGSFKSLDKKQLEDFAQRIINARTKQRELILSDDQINKRIKEEMADVLIRVLDWWSAYDDDPIDMIKMKLLKNRKRGTRHGGKKY